ncbi:MAG TPA: adenosylcobinamide-GDP ribazoletransferase [Vicinamibacteria bacterium]
MTRLLAALAFLTRVPVSPFHKSFDASEVGRAALVFPLIGAAIGLLQLGAFQLLRPHLPSLLTAVLVVALSAWVTRGLHLDGLADFADGLGGGATRDDALRVMRDPAVGAFGVIALVLVLAVKIAAVDALSSGNALVLASALSRWSAVPLGVLLPYAREGGGLGAAMTGGAGRFELFGSTALALSLSFFVPLTFALRSWVAVLLVSLLVGAMARRRLGGMTGDVLGANVELAETSVLVAALC